MLKRLLAWLGFGTDEVPVTTSQPIVQPVEAPVTSEVLVAVDKPVKKQRRPRKNKKNN